MCVTSTLAGRVGKVVNQDWHQGDFMITTENCALFMLDHECPVPLLATRGAS